MRKYFAEFFGTLMLVAIGTGVAAFGGTSYGTWPIAAAFGLTVVAGAYAFGSYSGAHFNPAVSLGAAINGRITWTEFAGYVGAQIVGAFVGTGIVAAIESMYGLTKAQIVQVGFGQTNFSSPMNIWSATFIEFVLTFLFVLVILVLTRKGNEAQANVAPLAIGLTLVVLILLGITFTGASLNPARSLAPAVALALAGTTTALSNIAAYIIGPLAGAAVAAVVAKYAFGTEEEA